MKNNIWIIITLIIAVAILGYGGLSYQAKVKTLEQERHLEEERIETETAKEIEYRMLYSNCIDNAYERYSDSWDTSCENLGREKDCSLPPSLATRWDEINKGDEADCLELYGQ